MARTYVTGGPVKTEEDPFDPTPPREMRANLAALRHLEDSVLGAGWTEGIVLRYGVFYGPGTSLAPGAEQFELVRKRKYPVVGDGGGVWSFIHVADAADATVAAIEHGSRGVYNVVDDETRPGRRVAAGAGTHAGRQEADARAAVRRASGRRRSGLGDDDRHPRRVERQGQARAGLASAASEPA